MSLRIRTAPDVNTARHVYQAIQEYLAKYEGDQNKLSWREEDALHNYLIDIKVELEDMGYPCA